MNGIRVTPLVVALLCVAAIGVSSTTLESSLATEPDEAIDPDYDALPIGQEDVTHIYEEMGEFADRSDDGGEVREPDSGDPAEEGEPSGTEPDREDLQGGSDAETDSGGGDDALSESLAEGTGTGPGDATLLDRLLALLAALLRVLLPLLAVLAAGALAYRYRDRLLAMLLPEPEPRAERAVEASDDGPAWPDAEPANAIDRAWLALVTRLDPDRPEVMTPAESATAAVEAGMDPDAVEDITTAFEQVRYGGAPVTEERERRAREGKRSLEEAPP